MSLYARMDFEKRGKWLNLAPFGVGQYQNFQTGKAFLFLGAQSLLLGTALTTALMTHKKQGSDEQLQEIELYSFIGFLIMYAWGAYDAVSNYDKINSELIKQMKRKFEVKPKVSKHSIGLTFNFKY